jgi:hypothetical protein
MLLCHGPETTAEVEGYVQGVANALLSRRICVANHAELRSMAACVDGLYSQSFCAHARVIIEDS